MKKIFSWVVFSIFLFQVPLLAADAKQRRFSGSGEVTNVSPMSSRISIEHPAIKAFAEGGETEFFVDSKDLLAKISKGDLVTFEIADNQGDVKIISITRTGIAEPKPEGLPVGRAVQGVLEGAGQVVNGVTQPVEPVNQVANSTMGATTQTTGTVLNDAAPDTKNKF